MNLRALLLIACCVSALNANNAANELLKKSWEEGSFTNFTQALADGADANMILEESGYPVLLNAVYLSLAGYDNTEMVRTLIAAGANTNITIKTENETFSLAEFATKLMEHCNQNIKDIENAIAQLDEDQPDHDKSLEYLQQLLQEWHTRLTITTNTCKLLQ